MQSVNIEPKSLFKASRAEVRQVEQEADGTLKSLLKNKLLRKNLAIMMLNFSFGSFGFFVIPFYFSNLSADIYVIAAASGFAELLASFACIFIVRQLTLKASIIVFIWVAFAACLSLIFAQDAGTLALAVLVLIANFGITSMFDMAYLINVELFPTMYLGTAYGACNILARFISILSPKVGVLPPPWPMSILVCFSFIVGMASFALKPLKDLKSS